MVVAQNCRSTKGCRLGRRSSTHQTPNLSQRPPTSSPLFSPGERSGLMAHTCRSRTTCRKETARISLTVSLSTPYLQAMIQCRGRQERLRAVPLSVPERPNCLITAAGQH